MDPKNKRNSGGGNNNKNLMGIVSIVLWALIIVLMVNYVTSMATTRQSTEIDYSEFVQMVRDDKVAWVVMESNKYTIYPKPDAAAQTQSARPETADSPIPGLEGLMQSAESGTDQWKQQLKSGPSYYCAPIASDSEIARLIPLMEEHGVVYGPPYVEQLSPIISLLISYVLPVIIMVVLFSFLFRNMSSKMGGGLGGVGKANAKVYVEKKTGVTFRDVAGQDEAKESLEEIIDILHNPQKYTEIGAKLPKGALLVGPPGTGKTLLAKAVAGEAGVPFFSISGSDFVEMFVGVGASRVRDLFKEASKMAPCIIFIDEIDTIGKSRDNRLGGNDEREQTLNQLLAELDGFDPTKGVIVLAATNRPEVLDQALLRPGRFDRRITVDRPNLAGRVATLQVHTRNIRLSEDVDLNKIAQATAGAVGADLANLVNEAALRAVRLGRRAVNQEDLLKSFELVIAGSEKKGTVLTEHEKKLVAYHEVGHALVAAKQKNTEPVQKITIVPHTQGALGFTLQTPEEEKFLNTKDEILAKIRVCMGGRAAEELIMHTQTTGAAQDIQQATSLAQYMVTMYGMSDEFGMTGLASRQSQYLEGGYGLNCAQETAAQIDRLVTKIIKDCYAEAIQILRDNEEMLHAITSYLLQKETITGTEMKAILEGRDPELAEAEVSGVSRAMRGPAAQPAVTDGVEAPARNIHIVSDPPVAPPSPAEEPGVPSPPDENKTQE
ncbi:ATP-dependent zinc metalloprotease FtsH [uncultured Flavonifractor sp.]|nr:ATP-dependent zinc metalloprotease FtsH [Oscillospiraceae bacterium]CUP91566.1 ATP-dependent zinc metalloprotease FtsH [Flavonifractor plautii]SCJ21663.1 ATP-dependent zinc metalloprotease FtsH [uncultured Flavonifractor sp.]